MKTIASDKTLCVVGLGLTGLSCARFLAKQGKRACLVDTRKIPPSLDQIDAEFPDFPRSFGPLNADELAQMDEIYLSPGLSQNMPELKQAKESGAKIRGDIDLFAEHANAPVIAITGSNGKSTVTTLVGEMAKAQGLNVAVGGNLGTPALDLLDDKVELYVIELSSFQLETTENLSADVVTLLNISEDHMDRYPDRLSYLNAKRRIFLGAKSVAVNDDDILSAPMVSESMKLLHFGLARQDLGKFSVIDTPNGEMVTKGFEDLIPVSEIAMKGRHNVSNALAALALGSAAGLRMDAMCTALKQFKGLDHRCEWVRHLNGVDYINDSKGTNTGAAKVAIESFGIQSEGKVIWLAGGEGKDADFSVLQESVTQYVSHAILFGRDANTINEAVGSNASVHCVGNLKEAVSVAKGLAKEGDTVLLSPACASFDMFENYQSRGDAFKEEVMSL